MRTWERGSVGLLVVLVACSKPKPEASNAAVDTVTATPAYAGPKACDLISADAVKAAVGKEYKPGVVESDYGFDSQCKFEGVAPTDSAVLVTPHAKGEFEPYKHVPNSFPVASLGDDAIWNTTNRQIAVKKDSAVFSISFMGETKQQTAVKLARTALEKL